MTKDNLMWIAFSFNIWGWKEKIEILECSSPVVYVDFIKFEEKLNGKHTLKAILYDMRVITV